MRRYRHRRWVDPEAPTSRDYNRIDDIRLKAGMSSDPNKAEQLANAMANKIYDADKAYRRYKAACYTFDTTHVVAQIFLNRYKGLKDGTIVEPEARKRVTAVEKQEAAKASTAHVTFGSEAVFVSEGIEVSGTEIGNDDMLEQIFESERLIPNGVIEIWQSWSHDIYHISRNSTSPVAKIGTISNVYEKGEFIFGGKMIDWINVSHRKEAETRYGNSLKVLS